MRVKAVRCLGEALHPGGPWEYLTPHCGAVGASGSGWSSVSIVIVKTMLQRSQRAFPWLPNHRPAHPLAVRRGALSLGYCKTVTAFVEHLGQVNSLKSN